MFIAPWPENDVKIRVDQAYKHTVLIFDWSQILQFMFGGTDSHYWSRRASFKANRIPPGVRGNVSADMSGTMSSIAPAQATR